MIMGTRKDKSSKGYGVRLPAATLLSLFSLLFLLSCGGALVAGGGTGGTGIGPVTGFGSVRVGGVEFFDDNTTAVIDDEERGIDNVVEGMMVTVHGTMDANFRLGTAVTIMIEREVRGPVDDNGAALDNNTLKVLGQTILTSPATVFMAFGGGEIDLRQIKSELDAGLHPELEVHGGVDDRGFIHATFVGQGRDNVVANDNVGLRGKISDLNGGGMSFRIGGQAVNYAAMPPSGRLNWPITGLSDGLIVDVRGRLDAVGGGGIVRAERIEVKKPAIGNPQDRVRMEGYVVSGTVSGFVMTVPNGTVSVSGGVPSGGPFGIGRRVEVRGVVMGTIVQASSVKVLVPNDVLMEASPTALPGDPGMTSTTMKMLGKVVETNDLTLFKDESGGIRSNFDLTKLLRTDRVRVVGFFDNSTVPGKVVAASVERTGGGVATGAPVTLQGPIGESAPVSPNRITIIGILVRTGMRNNTDYYEAGDVPTDQAGFFASLSQGTVVRVTNGLFSDSPPVIDDPDPAAGFGRMVVETEVIND